jgi:hypothetical protein
MRRIRLHLSYANVVATVALFVALGGGAYAAVTIDGKDLKARSVAGGKLKNDTLTGKQIKESKLKQVPNAAKLGGKPAKAFLAASGTAADAAKLGGQAPSAYFSSNRIASGGAASSAVPAATVLTYAPLSLTVTTDGDVDSDSTVRIINNGPNRIEVSNSAGNGINAVSANGGNLELPTNSASRVTTFVLRQVGTGVDTRVGAMITCGWDFNPDVVNCVAIGI